MLRMKTDINFKQVQRSVFEMIGKKSEIESTSKKDKVTDEDFNRSEVKKKII